MSFASPRAALATAHGSPAAVAGPRGDSPHSATRSRKGSHPSRSTKARCRIESSAHHTMGVPQYLSPPAPKYLRLQCPGAPDEPSVLGEYALADQRSLTSKSARPGLITARSIGPRPSGRLSRALPPRTMQWPPRPSMGARREEDDPTEHMTIANQRRSSLGNRKGNIVPTPS